MMPIEVFNLKDLILDEAYEPIRIDVLDIWMLCRQGGIKGFNFNMRQQARRFAVADFLANPRGR